MSTATYGSLTFAEAQAYAVQHAIDDLLDAYYRPRRHDAALTEAERDAAWAHFDNAPFSGPFHDWLRCLSGVSLGGKHVGYEEATERRERFRREREDAYAAAVAAVTREHIVAAVAAYPPEQRALIMSLCGA